MALQLKQLRVGKVDGKHEYLTPASDRDTHAFDAFLMPDTVDPTRLNNKDIFFIEGFRGTGKTSLLRWHAEKKRQGGALTEFILFKTDLNESQRLHISKEIGISWLDIDSRNMEVSQDFKSAWTWFIQHKIGEILKSNPDCINPATLPHAEKAIRLLGLNDDSIFTKAIGFMPKLEGANVKIKADIAFFEAELGGDFVRNPKSKENANASLESISRKIFDHISKVSLSRPIYIYFDELEAFYHTPEQHRRDQRMVRDLLFSVGNANERFRKSSVDIHVVAAVRSEVIDNMGALGQEVDRLVHDCGFNISWHHANKSQNHPLIQIICRKINSSERENGIIESEDPISSYFSRKVNNSDIETFLLDRSFYKPRDMVWRLSLAQKLFPNETKFTNEVLHDTEIEYSTKLWDEVRYELSATYSEEEIDAIELVLSGGPSIFELHHIEMRFNTSEKYYPAINTLLNRRSVREILSDLYRLGAIGNNFRTGKSGGDIRNRWSFRGDPKLLPDKRMVIHQALEKRLSAVAKRRRGSQGTNRGPSTPPTP